MLRYADLHYNLRLLCHVNGRSSSLSLYVYSRVGGARAQSNPTLHPIELSRLHETQVSSLVLFGPSCHNYEYIKSPNPT